MKYLSVLFFLIALLLVAPTPSSAHVSETLGSNTVLMHIEPDDDPIVGQPVSLQFFVTDTSKKFFASSCNCQVEVTEAGKRIAQVPLGLNRESALEGSVTFPERGVYVVVFKALPKNGEFDSFTMRYPVRLTRTSTVSSNIALWLGERWYFFALAFVGLGVAALLFHKALTNSKDSR